VDRTYTLKKFIKFDVTVRGTGVNKDLFNRCEKSIPFLPNQNNRYGEFFCPKNNFDLIKEVVVRA